MPNAGQKKLELRLKSCPDAIYSKDVYILERPDYCNGANLKTPHSHTTCE